MLQHARRAGRACGALGRAARRYVHSQQLVRDALREAREQLLTCASDAKALVAHALRPRLAASNDVFLHLERQLTREEAQALRDALERRSRGEPLAYVTGSREFWSLPLRVSPATLIPRSDSEVLIETLAAQYAPQSALRILDVGTGSGCLLLAALSEFPRATGVGVDISRDALCIAQLNAGDLALADRASFLQCDLRELRHLDSAQTAAPNAVHRALFQQFDVVLCNPPYIPRGERHLVAADVLAHEPHLALFSDGAHAVETTGESSSSSSSEAADDGDDDDDDDPQGLKMYRWLQQSIVHLLKPTEAASRGSPIKSAVILEVGSEAQARAVQALFAAPSTRHLGFQRLLIDGQQRPRGLLFESLAARQAALLKQNAELNERVVAIEQRRQQQLTGASSARDLHDLTPDEPSGAEPHEPVLDDEEHDAFATSDVPGSARPAARKADLAMDLSASIDSFGSRVAEAAALDGAGAHDETEKSSRRKPRPRGASSVAAAAAPATLKHQETTGDSSAESPDGLGLEATVRYQKARLRVLQDEVDTANFHAKELVGVLKAQLDELRAETGVLAKKCQQTQQLLDKQRELSAAQEAKQRVLEAQLAAAQARADEVQRTEKQAAQQFRSKDVRLNRALEELEKVKSQLQDERRARDQDAAAAGELEQLARENKRLEKHKGELLVAFKKQMKLIDLLKRQRIHMEAAKMLSFTEEEFSKTLELG
ncbi:hypothetical protein PybrP1_007789 [[Pythium] brassicae (nom. inval.)]|nr:hypothetical protein PybrP1_007789 [[Pythium] brassicae (nom. inval.)]